MKYNIDLDSNLEQYKQKADNLIIIEKIKTKIDKSLKEFENKLKNNNKKIKG